MGLLKSIGKVIKKVAPIVGTVASVATGNPLFAIAGNAVGSVGPGGGTIKDVALNAAGTLGGSALMGSAGLGTSSMGSAGSGNFLSNLTAPFSNFGSSVSNLGSILSGGTSLSSLLGGNQNAGYSPGAITSRSTMPDTTSHLGAFQSQLAPRTQTYEGMPWQNGGNSYGTPLAKSGGILSKISDNPLMALQGLMAIKNSFDHATPAGATSATDNQGQIEAQRANDAKLSQNVLASLTGPGLNRQQTNPQVDYYHYGQRPEAMFYDQPNPGMRAQ